MTPHRATDNIQQKASNCLGTVNEKPYTLAQRMIDQNEIFSRFGQNHLDVSLSDPDLFMKIENWKRGRIAIIPRNDAEFESGGIVNNPNLNIYLNKVYVDNAEFVIK